MTTVVFKEFVGKIDADGNGYISPEEFTKHFKDSKNGVGMKMTDEQIQEAISSMDKDSNGMFKIKKVVDWMVKAGYLTNIEGLGFFLTILTSIAAISGAGMVFGAGAATAGAVVSGTAAAATAIGAAAAIGGAAYSDFA